MHKTFTEYPLALFSSYEKYVDKCKELLKPGELGWLTKDEFLWHQEYAPQYSFIVLRTERLASTEKKGLQEAGIPETIRDTAANLTATQARAVEARAWLRHREAIAPTINPIRDLLRRQALGPEMPQREVDQPEVDQPEADQPDEARAVDARAWQNLVDRVRRDTQIENNAIHITGRRALAQQYGVRAANVEEMIQEPNWAAFNATWPGLPIVEEEEAEREITPMPPAAFF